MRSAGPGEALLDGAVGVEGAVVAVRAAGAAPQAPQLSSMVGGDGEGYGLADRAAAGAAGRWRAAVVSTAEA